MISNFFKNPNIQFKNDDAVKDALKELFAVFWYCLLFSGISLLVVSLIDFVIKLNHQFSFMDAIDHAQQ
ncbi:hypothetical protein DHW03_08120 [Pedobacter yonginense]|uniref:Uncharacterized protein n=1 Tax=Pedobacter yonginense TaxID=651869 RepID=A0A317ENM5_9SPHI|nr:hypothetical protein DHW03_08120 [Pedobacter yonginense]